MMKTRSRIGILAVAGLALAAGLALTYRGRGNGPRFSTAVVDRGDIADVVGATGLLQAVTTVQVGSQVSGTIKELYADFNSNVKKGQVIARLDPSLFEARVAQAKANLASARADVDRAQAAITDAKQKFERARQLAAQNLLPPSDLESAQAAYDSALAQYAASKAAVSQSEAALNQAQVDLAHTVIEAPIDGVVLARNVDVGQTVAASFSTPTLFTIAQDLTKMEIDTSVDEADISRISVGQPVTFTVDSYPETRFAGKVVQIRNAPVITQNVVTYVVVIGVDNKELKLKPGMTANVSIETARKENVLKLPAAALRFKPKGGKGSKDARDAKEKPAGADPRKMKKGAGQQVFILSAEQKPVAVPIKTGITNDGQVELVEGTLKENDEVIVEQLSSQKKSGGMGGGPMGPRF